MVTHAATKGFMNQIIGYYECFDSANRAALEHVRACRPIEHRYADVRTVEGALVVRYDGNAEKLHGDPGPTDLSERKALGWEVPK